MRLPSHTLRWSYGSTLSILFALRLDKIQEDIIQKLKLSILFALRLDFLVEKGILKKNLSILFALRLAPRKKRLGLL